MELLWLSISLLVLVIITIVLFFIFDYGGIKKKWVDYKTNRILKKISKQQGVNYFSQKVVIIEETKKGISEKSPNDNLVIDSALINKFTIEETINDKPIVTISNKIENIELDEKSTLVNIASNNNSIKRQTHTPYIDENKIEIKVIKSNPDPDKSEPKRIGFIPNNNFLQTEPYKYAVVKMPKSASLIKFPRKGRSDKKGFKEDDFYLYLNQYFKSGFNVFNDRHIPTNNGRPYEPDFVLSNEKDNKNIFINIEIDEPYDGWLRTPTHCIGDNDSRDEFFANRGWIVIRFAEIQIHQEPKKCCAFIAKVIASIDVDFKSEILLESNPNSIGQWDNLQSKKWANEKYREKYLGILNFGKRPNVITEYEITDSELDKEIEKEIPKANTKFDIEHGLLALKNKNDRDNRITFDPIKHRYFIDGNPDTISVTQLIDKFFPEFDSPYWAPIKASQRGISTEEILAEWEAKRINSASKGTALHEAIENYYNRIDYNKNTTEFEYFLSFKQRYNTMVPHRTEWRIFDEDLLIAGTIDMAYRKEDGSLYMFDWKRSEKVVRQDGTIKNETYQFAFGELNHLGDNSFNKYCLQQNIYKAILEKRYNQKISSMNLLILHENFDKYHLIQIPNMEKEVNYILNYALILK